MSKLSILVAMALSLLLAGCGSDPQAASKSVFKKAISAWNDAHPVCIKFSEDLPIEVPAKDAARRAGMDALVAAQLMTATPISKEPATFGYGSGPQPHIRYQPTAAGKSFIHSDANHFLGGTDLCFGKHRVQAIRSFTAPADFAGMRMSRVTYAWKLEPEPWTSNPAIRTAFPVIADALDEPEGEATDALVLTSDGWVNEHAIGSPNG